MNYWKNKKIKNVNLNLKVKKYIESIKIENIIKQKYKMSEE